MFRCSAVILMCLMIAVLDGNTDEVVSLFRSHVHCIDNEENTGCWFRKRRVARRSYSLAEPPDNTNYERWNQSGFDTHPVTPPVSENRRNRDEVKTFPPLGRRQRSSLGSSIFK
jgi:hypothetical protein